MLQELKDEFDIVPTAIQKAQVKVRGMVKVGKFKRVGWNSTLPFYLFECPIHGLVYDYPHGYWAPWKGTIRVEVNGILSQLYCPLCEEDRRFNEKKSLESGSVKLVREI